MNAPQNEVRPRRATEGDTENTGGRLASILAPAADERAVARQCLTELDELAQVVDGTFVVVVEVTGGRYRRRSFLTVASAQRAADRARATGQGATVYLAELRPLWRVGGER